MNGNRGAKGSVNDRLISMMYRKRYKDYMKKRESYNKLDRERQKEYLEKIKLFDIDYGMPELEPVDKNTLEEVFAPLQNEVTLVNPLEKKKETIQEVESSAKDIEQKPFLTESEIQTLINLGNNVTNATQKSEAENFDNYDYYELIATKSGIASLPEDEVIDIDLEIDKREDEVIILEEVTDFITESKELLSEIKFDLTDIKADITNQHTMEDIADLNEKYLAIKSKLDKLKRQYIAMKEKYDFEDYELLENLTLLSAIEDYRDKASLDELEGLVDACKYEVEEIDDVLTQEHRRVDVEEQIEQKEKEIETRDSDFVETKKNTIHLDSLEQKISEEASRQRKIISDIEKHLSKVETEIVTTTRYIYNTGQMFASFLRITAGILTAPFSNRGLFGIMLGSGLINRGLKDLRTSLTPHEVQQTEVREKYQSVEKEILSTKDIVGTTLKIIDNSIDQLDELQKEFKIKFEPYALYIPEYRKVEQMMVDLRKKLSQKQEKVIEMQEILSKQYEKNKQKVLRAS